MPLVNADEINLTRDWLKGLLTEGIVKVTFTKKDGTERLMSCTLHPNEVEYVKTPTREREPNMDVLPVFDTDKREWRSFRIDSVKKIEFTIGD